jgi:tetratricopeptide (TPR) repeat protein
MPQRPIFLSGKVMVDDGTPPPESVSIQRICAANPHTEAYTDSKGNFSFELGQRLGVMPDASEDTFGRSMGGSGSMSIPGSSTGDVSRLLMGCSLRASLPGYRSDSVDLTNRKSLDNPDVGTIILHRIGNVQGLTVSATSNLAPKDARKAFEKGTNDMKKGKWEDAQKEFEKATSVYDKYAAAWCDLGRVQEHQKNEEAAKNSYAKAIAADAKYVIPYNHLAGIAVRERNWHNAKDATDRLLSLDPVNFPEAYFYNALANYELKNFDAAEKSARAGIKADTDHALPRMNQLLGVLLAGKQDYTGAAESLKNYLQLAPNGPEAETVKKQLAIVEQKIQQQ